MDYMESVEKKLERALKAAEEMSDEDYLKLLNAYQFESSRIKEYPAMAQEDE